MWDELKGCGCCSSAVGLDADAGRWYGMVGLSLRGLGVRFWLIWVDMGAEGCGCAEYEGAFIRFGMAVCSHG